MIVHSFINGHVVSPSGVVPEATLTVGDGIVRATAATATANAVDLDGGWVMPGFVDTQVNGGGGVLFNDAPTVDGIAAIGAAHRRFGTTAFLPTLISDTPAAIARALDAMDAAIAAGVPGVVGVHIEGPVLSPARPGIHNPARLRPLDDALLDLLTRPRRGRVMVTLAPERVAAGRIEALVRAGVVVSVGHSDATLAEARTGFAAGITGVTHLFNAMSPLLHRAPGVVGAALDDQQVYCGLIVDGIHVDDAALRLALRARPLNRFMLVSDAMPSVGTDLAEFRLDGRLIRVEDGRCVGADGTLAGCHLDMGAAVRRTITRLGVDAAAAAAMASANPAAFLGLEASHGSLAVGRRADWVRLDPAFRPIETVVGGEPA